jgi:hypothetical protein
MVPARVAEQALHTDTGYYILSYLHFSHFSVSDLIARHPPSVLVQKKSIIVIFSWILQHTKTCKKVNQMKNLKCGEKITIPLCSMSLA